MKRLLFITSLLICVTLSSMAQSGDVSVDNRSAQFPQGDFAEWVLQQAKYPEAALDDKITGVCVVKFTINANGELKRVFVTKSPHWSMEKELIRVLNMSPKWIPAIKDGNIQAQELTLNFDMSTMLSDQQLTQMKVVEQYMPPTYIEAGSINKSINIFRAVVEENIVIPDELSIKDIDTKVDVRFIIDTTGAIKELSVDGQNELLNKVVMNTIETQNKGWSPATVDAQPLAVAIAFSIPLKIEDGKLQQAPLTITDQMPTFHGGGIVSFRNWLVSKIEYPKQLLTNGVSGRVIINFIVEKDGSITNITPISSSHKLLSAEVLRVLKTAPKWTPGKQNGKIVRVKYTLPVIFSL